MTEQELNEWIGKHVMGYTIMTIPGVWKPTQLGNQAMMVLEKCAEKLMEYGQEYAVAIERTESGWRVVQSDEYNAPEAEAKTLPLTISLFARKLFSK